MNDADTPGALKGALADRYRLERVLGVGGMATVYLAEDLRHRRQVALKVLRPDLSAVLGAERFSKEIELTANLQHANILPLFDSGEAVGQLFYVMPFVEGETLRARMARGTVPQDEALAILRDVARALGYAHRRGVLHRDIKPENILLAGGAAVVADFGVAKALSASRSAAGPTGATLTSIGTSLGTPAYMAPEQAAGDPAIDQRADVYAWGLIAYELLAGRHLFAEQTTPQALMAAHISSAPRALGEVRREVSVALAALVMQCLAKGPDERPKDGEEIAARLGTVSLTGVTVVAPQARNARALVMGGAVVALLAVVVAGATMFRQGGSAPEGPQSIAVLPFDVGNDTANAYVADGLSAELTTKLARIPGLSVRAYVSSKGVRGSDPREAARQLDVETIVVASMRRERDRLHVNASLVSAADARVMWGQSFDARDVDQFALQDRLAEAIAGALRIRLSSETQQAMRGSETTDPIAHDLVQRSRYEADRLTDESLTRAIRLADEAVARDSTYVGAWAALANAYMMRSDDYEPAVRLLPGLRRAVERVVSLDPDGAEGHALAGLVAGWYTRDSAIAERELARALATDSTNVNALVVLGSLMLPRNRDSSTVLFARAIRRNPFSTTALYFSAVVPEFTDGFPRDSAVMVCDRLRSAVPPLGDNCDALRLWREARADEARARLRASDTRGFVGTFWAWRAFAAATIADTLTARAALQRVEESSRQEYIREDLVALAWTTLGERAPALRWARRAFESRVAGAFWVHDLMRQRFARDSVTLRELEAAYLVGPAGARP